MKKILFFIPSLTNGGAEKVLTDIVMNLDSSKYKVTVQTIVDDGIYVKKIQKNRDILYKTIIKKNCKVFDFIKAEIFYHIFTPKFIYNQYIRNDYDIEIAFMEGIATKCIAKSTNINAKKYAWVHTDIYNNFYTKKIHFSLEGHVKDYKSFNQIFCVSESAKAGFKKRFGFDNNVQVMYNLLDDNAIRKKASQPLTNIPEKRNFRLITVGRLTYQKGYDRLVRICKKLKSEDYSFELWIVGEGENRMDLEKYIAENELKEVKLLGFKTNPYQYMAQCDLFICSSRAEGFSLVVAEALILGIPVVSTDCAGPNELLEFGKAGLLVENTDQALHDGIIKMMTDSNLYEYYKANAQKRGKDFQKEKRLKEIEEILSR